MDYAKAAKIVSEIADDIVVGPDTGLAHVNIYRRAAGGDGPSGSPFSVMLPTSTEAVPLEPEDEQVMFIQSVQAAKRHFNAG